MRDAKAWQARRAPVALVLSVTPFPARLQSVPLQFGAAPPITISSATLRGRRAGFLPLGRGDDHPAAEPRRAEA